MGGKTRSRGVQAGGVAIAEPEFRTRAQSGKCLKRARRRPDSLVAYAVELVAEVKKRGFVADPVRRSWDLLAVTDEFEAWVIGWPAGGAIEFHDHGESKGAVVVLSGELLETRVVHRGPTLIGTRATTLSVGDTVELPSNCVHDVVNGGRTPAVSVHVYSPRLRSMTYYDLAERVLEPVRTVQYDDLG